MGKRKQTKPPGAKLAPDHPFHAVIAEAYRVFDFPTPSETGVCVGCCMYPEIEADFFNPPIAELPLHYLRDWFFAACSQPLARGIWGYLLPRVLEVLAAGEEPSSNGIEVSLNRFPTGDRAQWNEAQWDVLDRFRWRFLARAIAEDREFLDDTLCMFGNAGWPMKDLYAQVAAEPDAVLAGRFWNDWCRGCKPSIWITAFWDEGRNAEAFAFYTSRALHDRMARLALDAATPRDLAEKALDVAAVIEGNADWAQPG